MYILSKRLVRNKKVAITYNILHSYNNCVLKCTPLFTLFMQKLPMLYH